MLGRLILLFVLMPVVELALLIWLGGQIDVLPTVALVIGTGVLGAALTRYQGLRTWVRFQAAMAEGRLPHEELLDGLLILLAGAVLITPGLITDVCGFLLLVPAVRGMIRARFAERLKSQVVVMSPGGRPPRPGGGSGPIIDADFTVHED